MNYKISIGMVALILVSCVRPYGSKKDIEGLANLLKGSEIAWNRGDINGFMEFYSKDSNTQFITKRGRTKGWESTLNMYRKAYPDKNAMGILEFELDTIQILSPAEGLGQITGKWKLIRAADTPSGFYSLITRNTTNGPKIIIDHTW
jgi:hypothetical protein